MEIHVVDSRGTAEIAVGIVAGLVHVVVEIEVDRGAGVNTSQAGVPKTTAGTAQRRRSRVSFCRINATPSAVLAPLLGVYVNVAVNPFTGETGQL